jgi:hypothetical protein
MAVIHIKYRISRKYSHLSVLWRYAVTSVCKYQQHAKFGSPEIDEI